MMLDLPAWGYGLTGARALKNIQLVLLVQRWTPSYKYICISIPINRLVSMSHTTCFSMPCFK